MPLILSSLSDLFGANSTPYAYAAPLPANFVSFPLILNALTALACLSSSILLFAVSRKRPSIPFAGIVLASAAVLLSSGVGQILSIVALGRIHDTLDRLIEVVTGAASVAAAGYLLCVVLIFLKVSNSLQRQQAQKKAELEVASTQLTESRLQKIQSESREAESQARRIVDSMPQLGWVTTPEGKVKWFNARWYEYTGTVPEQRVANDEWNGCFHPDDRQETMRAWKSSVETKQPYEIEHRCRRHDGVYRWFLGRAMPLRGNDESLVGWCGTSTDIDVYKQAQVCISKLNDNLEKRVCERTTALAKANEELAASRIRLRQVLDSATGLAIIATDANGTIELFNSGAERMLQYSAGEMEGICSPNILLDPSEILELASAVSLELGMPVAELDIFAEFARNGRSEEREWTLVRKDGGKVAVSLTVTAIQDGSGALQGYLAVATDIFIRKSLERDLRLYNERLQEQTRRAEDANVAKSAFLAAMSHEIRTPMNAILGMADILWESPLNAEQMMYVEVFRRAGASLITLINDILDLSKLEARAVEFENVPFDLNEVVQAALELVAVEARTKNILLIPLISPAIPSTLLGDPNRLRQVLINLLGNAIKFTHVGEVVLRVENSKTGEPGQLEFEVADTGIGISPSQIKHIFEDFTQGDSSITREFGGTGLGLAISRRLVESFGGQLTVTSSLGSGSSFRFSANFGVSQQPSQSNNELEDLHGRRVLVIDPCATSRLILRETLSSWGIISSAFESMEGALAGLSEIMAGRNPYALAILDSSTPVWNDIDPALDIKRNAPRLPVVMLASSGNLEEIDRERKTRLSGYAVKPVKRSELLQLVCDALRSQTAVDLQGSNSPANLGAEAPRSVNILVAEDMPDNRLLIQVYMKGSPHQVTFVADGRAAVDAACSAAFGLILMDWQMPGMDGLTAVRSIREFERQCGFAPVPILALTANARAEDVQMSREAGCDGHLSKPISKQKLLNAIEEYMMQTPTKTQTEPILVSIIPGLEDIVPGYLESRRLEYPEMLALLAASDFKRIAFLGHNLKGTGAAYGFPELTAIGAAVESFAKKSDENAVRSQLDGLGSYLSKVELLPAG